MSRANRYSDQFKRDAVRLITDEGYSISAAAEAVGVSQASMSKWLSKYSDQPATTKRYASEKDELEALRAENRRLRMEREILKKAAVFFANDQSKGISS